ncbi:MAG TPA: tetratricopeptide repeat protein [Rhodospirillales bacterium]|nr:tetratricopeptide repeat protein [Rhodospirillales bacterium]
MTDNFEKAKRLHGRGRYTEAEELYAQVIVSNDRDPEALYLLGTLLGQRGKLDEALIFLERAVNESPKNSVYHCNLGVIEHNLKKLEQAKISFLLAINLNNKNVDAHYNLAKLYKELGLTDAALFSYGIVLSLEPSHLNALINLGNILVDVGRLDDAIIQFKKVIELNPKDTLALVNLGNVYRRMGLAEKAINTYGRVLSIHAHDGLRIRSAVTLPVVYKSLDHIKEVRESLELKLEKLLEEDLEVSDPSLETSTTNFFLAYQNYNDRDLQKIIANIHLNSCSRLGWTAPHCNGVKRERGKIKIGFLSAYFYRHSVGRMMVGLISQIPKNLFEVVVITTKGQKDSIALKIQGAADHLVYISENLIEMQEEIGRQKLDVLFYADIGMDVRSYFLAFARLAPVQCLTWGHPDTTGIPNMDTFLSSSLIEPADAKEHYSENLYCFSTLPTFYYRPNIPERLKSRAEFGFDEKQHIYFCPQSTIKFHPDVDKIFAKILKGDQEARILLLEGAIRDWTGLLRNRWRKTIGDLENRIDILPRQSPEDFISLQSISDVILDTPYFSGGNTTYESFALGKAVVTLDSTFMRGRVSAGMYRIMGIEECTALTLEEYIQTALTLGTNSDFRREIENKIMETNASLFEYKGVVDEFIDYVTTTVL